MFGEGAETFRLTGFYGDAIKLISQHTFVTILGERVKLLKSH